MAGLDDDVVTVSVLLPAPPGEVWETLTGGRGRWWPEMVFDAAVGAPLRETWTEDGRTFVSEGRVTEVIAGELLGFEWNEDGWDSPLEVRIRLEPTGESTTLTLTEAGFAAAPEGVDLRDEHREGWHAHLADLGGTVAPRDR